MRHSKYKTSIFFSLKDSPGSLYDALSIFKKYQINLSKIVSRSHPTKLWQYIFMVEFEGSTKEQKIKKALQQFKKVTLSTNVIGSYPTRKI